MKIDLDDNFNNFLFCIACNKQVKRVPIKLHAHIYVTQRNFCSSLAAVSHIKAIKH